MQSWTFVLRRDGSVLMAALVACALVAGCRPAPDPLAWYYDREGPFRVDDVDLRAELAAGTLVPETLPVTTAYLTSGGTTWFDLIGTYRTSPRSELRVMQLEAIFTGDLSTHPRLDLGAREEFGLASLVERPIVAEHLDDYTRDGLLVASVVLCETWYDTPGCCDTMHVATEVTLAIDPCETPDRARVTLRARIEDGPDGSPQYVDATFEVDREPAYRLRTR